MIGREQNVGPTRKTWMKLVDLREPTSFLHHVYLRCTPRGFKPNETIVDENRKMFESRISVGATENYQGEKNLTQRRSRGPSTWKDMLKNALRYVVSWRMKDRAVVQSLNPCLDDHHFKKEELETVGELSDVCSQKVLKCLYLARIGRPDILWSANKLARAGTKWTRACDRRLARSIAYIHHANDHRQHCHVGYTAQHCRLGLFPKTDFAACLKDSLSTLARILCIFGSRTFVPISWMCKKQTSVSHSSTESEIISLDAGVRMDGISALDLWDVVIEVVHSSKNTHQIVRDHC